MGPQLRQRPAATRMETTASSAVSSSGNSPFDSPAASASSTSLSSMSEGEQPTTKSGGKLIDGYGNEFTVPTYTIKQVRDAIPKHCFERSGTRGLLYVLRDLTYLAVVFYAFYNYCTPEYVPNTIVRGALWGLYTFLQGLSGTGVWVLAHECGHQSFSPSKTLNDTVGWVLHSSLLVPYFSWKISHGNHHKNTGHMDRDTVFVPATREKYASGMGKLVHEVTEATEEAPIVTLALFLGKQLVGWPMYLLTNATHNESHHEKPAHDGKRYKNGLFGGVNHFNPNAAPLFRKQDRHLIALSDLGLAIVGAGLYALVQKFGFMNMLVWYFIPYLWVNHWLVAITFIQHTDPSLPHYTNDAWTFTRGAAATIDHDFGFIGRHFFHDILDTHVLHHIVSLIPFYHAEEATEAIKPVLGDSYRFDKSNIIAAVYRSMRMCQWVEPAEGTSGDNSNVLFFRNNNHLGTAPTVLKAS